MDNREEQAYPYEKDNRTVYEEYAGGEREEKQVDRIPREREDSRCDQSAGVFIVDTDPPRPAHLNSGEDEQDEPRGYQHASGDHGRDMSEKDDVHEARQKADAQMEGDVLIIS